MIYSLDERPSHADSSSRAILMVDDEEDILPEYQEFLELKGFNAAITADPEEAVRIVQARRDIAVVITDWKMARLNGAELIRHLRASLPADRRVQFIILTGDASSRIDEDLADVPILIKPADTDQLLLAVRTALAAAQ